MRSRNASENEAEHVVVVHGLWMPGWETIFLRRRLEAAGFKTHPFVYPTVGCGLDENADRLAEFASALPGRVHFVGHSLGGVLIVRCFDRHALPGAGRIVCLGSPLLGTHAGRVLASYAFGRRIVGRCICDLIERGGCRPWNGPWELGIIAGDLPLGAGRLLGGLPKPHDGTVAVEETRLPGATAHLVVHATHLSMLWSREVAAQVVHFLREGRFAA
ncbi:MAG: alpha/beta hydrolase [Gammaproteobacteria bacterium]